MAATDDPTRFVLEIPSPYGSDELEVVESGSGVEISVANGMESCGTLLGRDDLISLRDWIDAQVHKGA